MSGNPSPTPPETSGVNFLQRIGGHAQGKASGGFVELLPLLVSAIVIWFIIGWADQFVRPMAFVSRKPWDIPGYRRCSCGHHIPPGWTGGLHENRQDHNGPATCRSAPRPNSKTHIWGYVPSDHFHERPVPVHPGSVPRMAEGGDDCFGIGHRPSPPGTEGLYK